MRYLLLVFLLVNLTACEDNFEKERYDVSLYFKNSTSETVALSVNEIEDRIKWEHDILPGQTFQIKFNIKKDINSHEGGFIYKAEFPDGELIEKNTGYYTNYQFQQKNPSHIEITKTGFEIE